MAKNRLKQTIQKNSAPAEAADTLSHWLNRLVFCYLCAYARDSQVAKSQISCARAPIEHDASKVIDRLQHNNLANKITVNLRPLRGYIFHCVHFFRFILFFFLLFVICISGIVFALLFSLFFEVYVRSCIHSTTVSYAHNTQRRTLQTQNLCQCCFCSARDSLSNIIPIQKKLNS